MALRQFNRQSDWFIYLNEIKTNNPNETILVRDNLEVSGNTNFNSNVNINANLICDNLYGDISATALSVNSSYILPTTIGSANQVLTVPASGNVLTFTNNVSEWVGTATSDLDMSTYNITNTGGYNTYQTLGTNKIINTPSNTLKVGGVNISAINKRTRTSHASAVKCVSTWITQTSAADNNLNSVCWAPELGLFCAVAATGTGNRVMTSPDGITWTIRTSAANNFWTSVCWAAELGLFCAVSSTGTGNRVMTSPDGITWTTRTSAADNFWNSVCWAAELGLFCAVAESGVGNRVMTSPDGITWTTQTSAVDNDWFSVCWAAELGLFCAVATSGTGNRVMTSPDGITWTIRTSAADNFWTSVCWAAELGLFCAVAASGVGNRVMTSPDGITWTTRTSAAEKPWKSICWAPELGLFCAVSYTVTANLIMTSPDGITWTTRTSAADSYWTSICWAPELGIFCAVAESGIGNRVMTTKYKIFTSKNLNSNLDIVGNIQASRFIGDVSASALTVNSSYKLPSTIGSANQVLTVPASGNVLTFTTPSAGGATEIVNTETIKSTNSLSNATIGGLAIGYNTGNLQGNYSIALGYRAADTSQAAESVALGTSAGKTQQSRCIAFGTYAGYNQNIGAIAIGFEAASGGTQLQYAISIGHGSQGRASDSIAIGFNTNTISGSGTIAIGNSAHANQDNSISIGNSAGTGSAGNAVIAIGLNAGKASNDQSIAIGATAGFSGTRGTKAIAIGNEAGYTNQGAYTIALGYQAGKTDQSANTIILNATGTEFNGSDLSGLYIKPIRNVSYSNTLFYDPTTGEIAYDTGGGGATEIVNTSGLKSTNATNALSGSIALGLTADASINCIAIGNNSKSNINVESIALGFNASCNGERSIAIGRFSNSSGTNCIAIGKDTTSSADTNIAIGESANSNGVHSVSLGRVSNSSNWYSIAIGKGANVSGYGAISIGESSQSSTNYSISIGSNAKTISGPYSIAIGQTAIALESSVAIGRQAGLDIGGGGVRSIMVGEYAGRDRIRPESVAVGYHASEIDALTRSVSIGYYAGYRNLGANSIAIGAYAGYLDTSANSIILNATDISLNASDHSGCFIKPIANTSFANALYYDPTSGEIAYDLSGGAGGGATSIVNTSGLKSTNATSALSGSVALGVNADASTNSVAIIGNASGLRSTALTGGTASGIDSISIGNNSLSSSTETIAIGLNAGNGSNNTYNSVFLGRYSGFNSNGLDNTFIGPNAGQGATCNNAISIGKSAGRVGNEGAVSIGYNSGNNGTRGQYAVAIGTSAGYTSQNTMTVAIGYLAGRLNQSAYSVAIGPDAGNTSQGQDCIAIGRQAGLYDQSANTIILNATGGEFNGKHNSGLYVKPIRNAAGTYGLFYDSGTGEITYNTAGSSWVGTATTDLNMSNFNITGINQLQGASTITIDPAGIGDNTGLVVIKGDLQIDGTTTTINSSILDISDHTILLASAATNVTQTYGAGIEISGNKTFTYESGDIWNSNIGITAPKFTGDISASALTVNSAYQMPTTIGTANQVLTVPASGNTLEFTTPSTGGSTSIVNTQTLISSNTGTTSTGNYSVVLGHNCNLPISGYNVIIGKDSGNTSAYSSMVTLGYQNCQSGGNAAVAIGDSAGKINCGNNSVSIGYYAGRYNLNANAIAIGNYAGQNNLKNSAIAIGYNAGAGQGLNTGTIAIGVNSGYSSTAEGAVYIGDTAGNSVNPGNTGNGGICIGRRSGDTRHREYCVTIGDYAGGSYVGAYTIAIGANAARNSANSATDYSGCIVFNAQNTGAELNPSQAGQFLVKPIRNATGTYGLYYDSGTGEITYNTAGGGSWVGTATNTLNMNGYTIINANEVYSNDYRMIDNSARVTLGNSANGGNYTLSLGHLAGQSSGSFQTCIILNSTGSALNATNNSQLVVKTRTDTGLTENNINVALCYDAATGIITKSSAGYFNVSDNLFKYQEKNIINALDIINKLQPVNYVMTISNYKNDNGEVMKDKSGNIIYYNPNNLEDGKYGEYRKDWYYEAGFIAQEVNTIPELQQFVNPGDESDKFNSLEYKRWTLSYNSLFTYNVAATQELSKQLDIANNKIQHLENNMNNILLENDLLKSKLNILLQLNNIPIIS